MSPDHSTEQQPQQPASLIRPAHPKLSHSLFAQAASQPPTDSEDPQRFSSTPLSIDSSSQSISSPMSNAPVDPNAKSTDVTVASGYNTDGTLNQHPSKDVDTLPTFRVGVSEDRNKKCRRTMEDAHSFIYDYCGVPGQGYFAVFDGHAGKNSAEWCGQHFHEYLERNLEQAPEKQPVPDTLNETFLAVDKELSKLAEAEGTHSGCTAVVAFLRIEDGNDSPPSPASPTSGAGDQTALDDGEVSGKEGKLSKVKSAIGKIAGSSSSNSSSSGNLHKSSSGLINSLRSSGDSSLADGAKPVTRISQAKRVLYTANAGDARAVICRRGKAVRLTYDHKGSDQQEAKRITDAGGFVMNNRVNGVLAVTRALGDASVKEFVVGSPYTTETRLDDGDEFLIIACDGLWDVAEDQDAVDLVRDIEDPQEASAALLKHALESFSTDNLSVLVVRLGPKAA